MTLFSWPLIGVGVLILLIPVLTGIILVIRSRNRKGSADSSESWNVQRLEQSRSGKPVKSCVFITGKTRQGIAWEMEAVSQDDPQEKNTAAFRNMSLIRSSFYTIWETEKSNLESEYVLISPRNVLSFYGKQPVEPIKKVSNALEKKMERMYITDIRRIFALSLQKSEDVFSSLRQVYPDDDAFRQLYRAFGSLLSQTERLLTPQLRSAVIKWKDADLSIGLSPNRTVILVSGEDLSDDIKRLELLVQLGETLLEVQEKITSPVPPPAA
ncbi:MAG TPA: hypothetical protein VKA68_15545 [bacterium]|nr:hypothetical protein [bacterium]